MENAQPLRRAIFLDRDGTLNKDSGYVCRKEDWVWLPGTIQALRRFQAAGYLLVVVSNQSGLARGLYTRDDLAALEAWVNTQLAAQNVTIDAWYYCPHLPEITGPCSCRKPEPGLLLQAARELGIDLAHSWMIGDSLRDVEAGRAAGCKCVLLRPKGKEDAEPVPAMPDGLPVAAHLAGAEVLILAPELRRLRVEREQRILACGQDTSHQA